MSAAKKPGIVAFIMKFIDDKGGKPFTHTELHAELRREFPDRNPAHMMTTVRTVVTPSGMKERSYSFTRVGKQITAQKIENFVPPHKPDIPAGVVPPVPEKIQKGNKAPVSLSPIPLRLFHYTQNKAEELLWRPASLELEIQRFIEKHMEVCLGGIRFVASELTIEDGRIDSLGLDKKNCPVIIEYKRNINENVVGQAITYLFSISRHKPYFQLPVLEKFGEDIARAINWKNIRVLCIAEDFTQYDRSNAKAHVDRNIELIRYKFFSDNTLALEWIAGNMPQ